MNRHMEEASVCAPAITARCTPEKAETLRGLPSGKPAAYSYSLRARDLSAPRRGAQSFRPQIPHVQVADTRYAVGGSDLLRLPLAISERYGAHLLRA